MNGTTCHFGLSVLDEQAEKLLIFTHNIHENGIKNIDVVSEIIEWNKIDYERKNEIIKEKIVKE